MHFYITLGGNDQLKKNRLSLPVQVEEYEKNVPTKELDQKVYFFHDFDIVYMCLSPSPREKERLMELKLGGC